MKTLSLEVAVFFGDFLSDLKPLLCPQLSQELVCFQVVQVLTTHLGPIVTLCKACPTMYLQ